MSTGELLTIEPQELQFPFELRKQLSCSFRLSNKADDYVAFKVKTTNAKNYCVRPNIGIVLPRSTCDVIVKMQAQKEAPPDMQCKDKFLLQSVVAMPGATRKDLIDADMFNKESGHHVEECKLSVVYVVPPQRPPSPVREGFMASRSSVKFHDSSPKDSCPLVKNILLLDSEGKRVAVKYFSDDWQTNSAKLAFEKSIFTKTLKTNSRAEAEIAMFESNIVIYKFIQDLHFFVTGGDDENELVLAAVLQGFCDAAGLLLRGNVDKKEALKNLDLILLCIDEIIDGGIILETDAKTIAGKVAAYSIDADVPLSKQTLIQALATASEHLTRSLLK